MYERLKKELERENKRYEEAINEEKEKHKKRIEEIERKMKLLKREQEKQANSEEKVKPVPPGKQIVYMMPEEEYNSIKHADKIEPIPNKSPKVYMVPEHKNTNIQNAYTRDKDKKLFSGIKKFFKRLFGTQKEEKSSEPVQVYIPPKKEEIKKMQVDTQHVYLMTDEKENVYSNGEESIIKYAKEIKSDKEHHKELKDEYLKALKSNDKDKAEKYKNLLWKSQSEINMSESFLRHKIKVIRNGSLSIEEKNKLINYVCGIAKIKTREKPAHMKKQEAKTNDDIVEDMIDELNKRKEKIARAKRFNSPEVRKQLIEEIDDEIYELSKSLESTEEKNKSK